MNKLMSVFLVLLAFSGWITGSIFLYASKVNNEYASEMAGENAFNIIEQSLKNDHSEAEVLAEIKRWNQNGWTAQTGSVITLCQSDRQRFRQWVTEKNISQICKEVK